MWGAIKQAITMLGKRRKSLVATSRRAVQARCPRLPQWARQNVCRIRANLCRNEVGQGPLETASSHIPSSLELSIVAGRLGVLEYCASLGAMKELSTKFKG